MMNLKNSDKTWGEIANLVLLDYHRLRGSLQTSELETDRNRESVQTSNLEV